MGDLSNTKVKILMLGESGIFIIQEQESLVYCSDSRTTNSKTIFQLHQELTSESVFLISITEMWKFKFGIQRDKNVSEILALFITKMYKELFLPMILLIRILLNKSSTGYKIYMSMALQMFRLLQLEPSWTCKKIEKSVEKKGIALQKSTDFM